MNNQDFIERLKRAKNDLKYFSETSDSQLFHSCTAAEIFWGNVSRNATFADGNFFSCDYLAKFPENQRRAAAIAVIDASILALKKLEIK